MQVEPDSMALDTNLERLIDDCLSILAFMSVKEGCHNEKRIDAQLKRLRGVSVHEADQ